MDKRKRYTIRIDPDHYKKAQEMAKKLGHTKPNGKINLSQFIRHLINQHYQDIMETND